MTSKLAAWEKYRRNSPAAHLSRPRGFLINTLLQQGGPLASPQHCFSSFHFKSQIRVFGFGAGIFAELVKLNSHKKMSTPVHSSPFVSTPVTFIRHPPQVVQKPGV